MSVVVFVYSDWNTSYPQFSTTVTSGQAQSCFDQATLYCANVEGALVPYDTTVTPPITVRLSVLYLLTAHIAQLQYGCVLGGALVPAGPLVGRVSSATQGSVSVSVEMKGLDTAAWFNQTQFGASAYQALAQFRTARYRASPGRYAFAGAPYPYRARSLW